MRRVFSVAIVGVALAAAAGCGQKKAFDGPTVEAFNGRVVADGKPLTLPPGEKIGLRLMHQGSGTSWGIPLQPDGTFNIGYMPIGKYTVMVTRPPGRRSRRTTGSRRPDTIRNRRRPDAVHD